MASLFETIQAAKIPYSNHRSDLYFKVTDQSTEILKLYPAVKPTKFVDNIDGEFWYEVPFAFDPFWEAA